MFSKIKNTIVGKILAGYIVIIAIAFLTSVVSIVVILNNRSIDKQISTLYYPSILSLKEAEILCSESYNLSNNWVYQPNQKEKQRLTTLIGKELPKFNKTYSEISSKFQDEGSGDEAKKILLSIESMSTSIRHLQSKLENDEAYADDIKVDEAIQTLEGKITPQYQALTQQLSKAMAHQNQLLAASMDKKEFYSSLVTGLYVGNIVLFILTGLYAARFSIQSISKPIIELSKLVSELSLGKFVQVNIRKTEDEIGKMGAAIESMISGLHKKVEFAESIGKGQYEVSFDLLSQEDVMGVSLIKMRDNLQAAAEDDRKRNWATEGFARFADVLRDTNKEEKDLYDSIISQLVKYLDANQGALFVVLEDEEGQVQGLELKSCYAYNRKKFTQKTLEAGEGLVGQVYLEKETIYMTDVPDQYTTITSGLGEATPSCIILVPLKLNDQVYGVLEMALFRALERYEVEFLEKLGESIASSISSGKINAKTRHLLEKTQIQAEEMRSQEEELRQNMEELQATQDEMRRRNHEMEAFTQAINTSCMVMEYDEQGTIVMINPRFCEITGYQRNEVLGQQFGFLIPESEKQAGEFERMWRTLSMGDHITKDVKRRKKNGETIWLRASFMPIFGLEGELQKISIIAFDITVDKLQEEERIKTLQSSMN
jgi:PAS domain S-box-containing protein